MSDAVERFNLRKGLGGSESGAEKSAPAAHPVQPCDAALVTIHSGRIDDGHPSPQADPEALLADIYGKLDSEKFAALIDSCQRECLEAVIRPFGLGRVLFEDKDGGNVDTVHNVRNNVYATSAEKERYDGRSEYNYYKYHDGNKDFSAAKRNAPEYHDLDHSVACSTIHNDQAVYLADMDGATLANIPQNHQFIGSIDNRAKGKDTAAGFLERLPDLRVRQEYAIKIIEERQRRGEVTDGELKALDLLRNNPELDEEALLEGERLARQAIDRKINRKYYTSGKFVTNTLKTSAQEGGKMALQQALGVVMEEFVRACFAEVKDAWHNGFASRVDERFLDALRCRLNRAAERVLARWKDAAFALRDGFFSGFLSNLVTVIINTFVTTAARQVRMLREGGMSLYQALKTLAFPDEGVSLAQAADAATKILAAGLVTAGGIVVEGALATYLEPLGPLASYLVSISVGLVTGLGTAFAAYMLDRIDLFGVHAQSRHEHVMVRLGEIIDVSEGRIREAAATFDAPALPHLA